MSDGDTQSPGKSELFSHIEWVEETGSTNVDLIARAKAGAPEGLVKVTDHQTAGLGRRDRVWEDRPGRSLLMSVLLRPTLAPEQLGLLPMVLGLAAVDAVQALGFPQVGLKWPNDLIVADPTAQSTGYYKLSGILSQSGLSEEGTFVVMGIGINVAWSDEELAELPNPAISLAQFGVAPDRRVLAQAVLDRLAYWYTTSIDDLLAGYRRQSTILGQQVRVDLDGSELLGVASGVDPHGLLEVTTAAGETTAVAAGDVVSMRPVSS